MPLLWLLRAGLNMTGAKFGCGVALCGACTVHVDRSAARACWTFVGDLDRADITRLDGNETPHAETVQAAWVELQVPQCGCCQSGQIMAALALQSDTPKPIDNEIDAAMDGNLCRCASCARVRKVIYRAAEIMEA